MSTPMIARPTSFPGFHGGRNTMNGHSHQHRRASSPVKGVGSRHNSPLKSGPSSMSTKDTSTKATHDTRHAVNGHTLSTNSMNGSVRHDVGEGPSQSTTQTVQDNFINNISNKVGTKSHDLADLLKNPLIFVPARLQDDPASKIPYDPLPTGPSLSSTTSRDSGPKSVRGLTVSTSR